MSAAAAPCVTWRASACRPRAKVRRRRRAIAAALTAATAVLSEAALCLAEDALPARGGVLTPAVVMGSALVPRLRKAGMTWEVRDL